MIKKLLKRNKPKKPKKVRKYLVTYKKDERVIKTLSEIWKEIRELKWKDINFRRHRVDLYTINSEVKMIKRGYYLRDVTKIISLDDLLSLLCDHFNHRNELRVYFESYRIKIEKLGESNNDNR